MLRTRLVSMATLGLFVACRAPQVFPSPPPLPEERHVAAPPNASAPAAPPVPPVAEKASGCADGTREGLSSPVIAACAGDWDGLISEKSAAELCAAGFHVCRSDDQALRSVSYDEAVRVKGCFAFNAANDDDGCRPCTGQRKADDMAGVGNQCKFASPTHKSCFASGVIKATCCDDYKTKTGCMHRESLTGVVCCKD